MVSLPVATVVTSHGRQSDRIRFFFLSEFTWQTCRKRQRRRLPALLASARFLSGLIVRRADDICPGLLCKLQPIGLAYAFFFSLSNQGMMDASTSISFINKICFCLNVSADGTAMKTPVREGSKDEKIHFTSTNKHVNTPYLSSQASIHRRLIRTKC